MPDEVLDGVLTTEVAKWMREPFSYWWEKREHYEFSQYYGLVVDDVEFQVRVTLYGIWRTRAHVGVAVSRPLKPRFFGLIRQLDTVKKDWIIHSDGLIEK